MLDCDVAASAWFRSRGLGPRNAVVTVAGEKREARTAYANFNAVVILAAIGGGRVADGVLVAGLLGDLRVEPR